MKVFWIFVIILIVEYTEADDPGFFLKTTKNIPRVIWKKLKDF